jgi:hypothetical protein
MVNGLLKIFWNAMAIAAVSSLIWIGIDWVEQKVNPPEPDIRITSSAVVTKIRDVEKLVAVQQDLNAVIGYNEAPPGLFNIFKYVGVKEDLVVRIPGTVSAGFNLSKIEERDIWISPDGKRIQITLPPPEIFTDDIQVHFEHAEQLGGWDLCPDDLLCLREIEKYQQVIVPEARQQLQVTAEGSQILDQAARNGAETFGRLFGALAPYEVRVVVRGYGATN